MFTIDTILEAYSRRSGKCTHTNDSDVFGVGFDSNDRHYFVYSTPYGGVFAQCEGKDAQLTGTCQFDGSNSNAVKRWLDSQILII